MDSGVLLMDLSERKAVIVVGGCYPGMETSMDFGVLLMYLSEKELNSNGGRWLLSRHGEKHGFQGVPHGLI